MQTFSGAITRSRNIEGFSFHDPWRRRHYVALCPGFNVDMLCCVAIQTTLTLRRCVDTSRNAAASHAAQTREDRSV